MAKTEYPEFTVILQDESEHTVRLKFSDMARYDLLRASVGEKRLPKLTDEAPIAFVGLSFIALKRIGAIKPATTFDTYLEEMFEDLEVEADEISEDHV